MQEVYGMPAFPGDCLRFRMRLWHAGRDIPRAYEGYGVPAHHNKETSAMLVLSRKKDEKIIIGDNITIMVVDIQGDKVRLGIDAPREVTVHREEVYQAIQKKQNDPEHANS
jgi:carbon storage regulator